MQRQKNIVCNTIIITVLLLKKKRKDKEYTMAICYLNSDYNNKYSCNYEIHDSGIDVTVDYDITDEIKAIDGVKAFGNNTEFANRDNNVDIKWIFERTDILYDIAIDIVFKNMLGFEKYTFNRRF